MAGENNFIFDSENKLNAFSLMTRPAMVELIV
jgi:hypothetical protein